MLPVIATFTWVLMKLRPSMSVKDAEILSIQLYFKWLCLTLRYDTVCSIICRRVSDLTAQIRAGDADLNILQEDSIISGLNNETRRNLLRQIHWNLKAGNKEVQLYL